MKKIRKLLLLSITLFLLISCASTRQNLFYNVSSKEADYALHLALGTACEKASDKLNSQLNKTDFLPSKYDALKTSQSIPGLSTLMSRMNNYYASYIRESMDFFSRHIKSLSESYKFKNPIDLLSVSNASASTDFIAKNRNKILQDFTAIMRKSDRSFFSSCVNQYNAYITTSNKKNDTDMQLMNEDDLAPYIAEKIVSGYFELLKSSEEFFRTTPDPYADETAAKVFKIN